MKKKSSALLFDFREIDEIILKILSRNRFGLSADKIRRDLPPSHRISRDQVVSRLGDLVSNGGVQVWHPPRRETQKPPHPIYSLESLETLIQGEILNLLRDQNLTPAQIKKSFPPVVNKYLVGFLAPLLEDRVVKWHPPLKGRRLSLKEPDPANFLMAEISKLLEKGERLGFPKEAVLQAAQEIIKPGPARRPSPITPEEAEKIIFRAMTALKPAAVQGALVYIPDLRKALADTFPSKESFDRSIVHLAELEKVQLQSHSLPAELTEEQRAAMIDNGRGSYFMAIGIRRK